jgi:orotate phosphoribosyltransferase
MLLKEELLANIRSKALIKAEGIQLASGQKSDFYIDSKKLSLNAHGLKLVSRAFYSALLELKPKPHLIAGVSIGGDPLVAGVLMEASQNWPELQGLLVRKEAKSHGLTAGRAVEGISAFPGNQVWMLEDIVSTGGSSLKAAQFLKAEGYNLSGIICLVDREMGGVENLTQALGIPVKALYKVSEVLASRG